MRSKRRKKCNRERVKRERCALERNNKEKESGVAKKTKRSRKLVRKKIKYVGGEKKRWT